METANNNEILQKTFEYIVGTDDIAFAIAGVFFVVIGCILSVTIRALRVGVKMPGTPNKFSSRYMFKDKIAELLLGFVLACICMRLFNDWIGAQATMGLGFVLGFCNYLLANLIPKVFKFLIEDKLK